MQTALRRANTILADRYASVVQSRGHDEAVLDIKEIVMLGMELVHERTKGRRMTPAQKLLVSAIHGGRLDQIVEEIAADVQDMVKVRDQKYLAEIMTRHGVLTFLPDVMIPVGEENFQRWQDFLNSLNPFSLRAEDPVTHLRGRIPFRDGVWLGDLVFAAEAPAAVIEDITEVRGNLMLRGHKHVPSHQLTLHGSLYVDAKHLGENNSCVASLGGQMRIYSDTAKTLEDLPASGPALVAWGAGHGHLVHLNDRGTYRLLIEEAPDGKVMALAECPGGQDMDRRSMRHLWRGEVWRPYHRKLPPDLAYMLLRRFRHICAMLGLGEDFVSKGRDVEQTLETNTERIVALFDLFMGKHSAKAAGIMPEQQRDLVEIVREALMQLKALALGEGKEYYRDMGEVTEGINNILETISDSKLTRIAKAIGQYCLRIDRLGFKSDSAYLKGLKGGDLDFGHVLGTAGRTVVFVNNLCRSRAMRGRAAKAIGEIRRDLKNILGKHAGQDLLLELLKFPDSGTMRGMHVKYSKQREHVIQLADHLHQFNQTPPLDLLQDFVIKPFKETDEKLDEDRNLLRQTLVLGRGRLNDVFADPPPGQAIQYNHFCRLALAVNMRSFLAEELKTMPADADLVRPSTLVDQILHKVERYRAIIPVFNRICSQTDTPSPVES